MQDLTQTQKKTLEFISLCIEKTGLPPTLREIANHFHWKAVGSAQDVVAALRKKGVLISNSTGKARDILPIQKTNFRDELDNFQTLSVPLLGKIQAGHPLEETEQHGESIVFPFIPNGVQKKTNYFALKVEGYSMQLAGFLPGDFILIEKSNFAKNKDIVVAQTHDHEITVKRYAQRGSALYQSALNLYNEERRHKTDIIYDPPAFLVPENLEYKPLPFGHDNDKIIGVVRSLFRKNLTSSPS